jgi:TrmH family RNA methyltransferase
MDTYPALSRRQRARIAQLKQKKFREERGELLLEGARLIGDALASGVALPLVVAAAERAERHDALLRAATAAGGDVYFGSADDMHAITDTEHSQGLVAVAQHEPPAASALLSGDAAPSLVTACLYVNDPGNLGTIIRTSDWFGLPVLLLSSGSVDPTNPKVVRATMGSFFRVRVGAFEDAAQLLSLARDAGYALAVTVAQGGADVRSAVLPARTLLVFGSEAHGVPKLLLDAADLRLTIPSRGGAESLNLAIAHGIVLSHLAASL